MRDALFSVLQQRQMVEANRLFAKQGNEKSVKPTRMIIRQFDGATNREQIRVIVRQPGPPVNAKGTHKSSRRAVAVDQFYQRLSSGPPGTETQVFESPDTLAHRISTLLLLDWAEGTRINLAKLSDAYRSELLQRGINPAFTFDTVSIQPQKTSGNVLVHQFSTPVKPNVLNKLVVPINPVRNLFAQVTFETPTFYLLRRMGWLLGGSVFLVLLTTGSFLFMLSTILRQKKLSEVKNDFINNMTHELKTPIATVTAAVEAMQHFGALDDPKKTQTYLTISHNNLQRLSDLVEKVLNLAVEEKRELVLNPEPIILNDVVADLVTSHQVKAPKPITFQVAIPTDTRVTVDRIHFENALNNLIDNAIKYSRERVTVQLTFLRTVTGWQLSVADDGIGIARTYQSAIFDRFFRVPTGNLHPVKGFGLGLAYVRQVVERHGGRVSLRSEPGKGSEFLLTFL